MYLYNAPHRLTLAAVSSLIRVKTHEYIRLGMETITNLFRRIVPAEPHELRALAWSFLYFFALLCAYYILRPLRDEMGILGGVKNLPWVFTGTFVVMFTAVPIFGWVAGRFARRHFVPAVYYFFIANILVFYLLFRAGLDKATLARAFFIWTSVFNLFVVSVFWSFMADLFSNAQARRLFGFIAGGGSAGAIVGPALTAWLAVPIGPVNLLLGSALLLMLAVVCIHQLLSLAPTAGDAGGTATAPAGATERPMGGGILDGIKLVARSPYLLGICLFIWLYTTLSTFVYFEQAHIIKAAFVDSAERTRVFASIDLVVNVLTIGMQVFLAARVISWFGVATTLALMPVVSIVGFLWLGIAPVLPVLVAFQIARRAGNYGFTRPTREILFTVVDRETKYKAKNFIDTVVFRGGDAVAGWMFAGLQAIGLGLAGIAFVGVPLAVIWTAVAVALGRAQDRKRPGEVPAVEAVRPSMMT